MDPLEPVVQPVKKAPSLKIIFLVTILMFAGITYGTIKLNEKYWHLDEKKMDIELPTEDPTTPENIKQGNLFMKVASLLAIFLLIIYILHKRTSKDRPTI